MVSALPPSLWPAQAIPAPTPAPAAVPPVGSRRRRLWDLPGHAHCPVVGVGLPLATLRRLATKTAGAPVQLDDYELHCTAVAECKRRSPLAEALQRELDQRAQLLLRQAASAKTEDTLSQWWQAASAGQHLGPALWTVLTHPACTARLEDRVLAQVHMLQHQVGAATRADLSRLEALLEENAQLTQDLAATRQRQQQQAEAQAARWQALDAELLRTRGELISRNTELAQLQERLSTLQQAHPDLPERLQLQQRQQTQAQRLVDLQRALQAAQQQAEQLQRRLDEALAAAPDPTPPDGPPTGSHSEPEPWLCARSVLCVGGRAASVPVYRQVVERIGGRFLHHDGGEQDSPHKLDATLAAADLVICQTGCVSHDAYWRVKDHCKRTGKRCVFVEAPSRTALERALAAVHSRNPGAVDSLQP